MAKKRVLILGATGSIGSQTIDVCNSLKDCFEIVGVSGNANVLGLQKIVNDNNIANYTLDSSNLVDFIKKCEPDIVVNAIVGAVGVECSYFVLKSNARLALANKESLVVAGDILMPLVTHLGQLMPVDSEHSAIFQCLLGEEKSSVSKLWITCSGGPFFGFCREELKHVTSNDAQKHPTWNMGSKITIDSATLMNKGLEVIEAHHLFSLDYKNIDVVVHRQSIIHSMVEFNDRTVKAQLGPADMRGPIQFALTYPKRHKGVMHPIDFCELGSISFEKPDFSAFRCLKLAYEAGVAGGVMPCALNAANEVANLAFREKRCKFLDIENCVSFVLENTNNERAQSLEQLRNVDAISRKMAEDFLSLN